ncbi:MAG: hypothetical protein JWP40_4780 [Blastococcus sp.]|nr:hypothetical protein [Blastococcus sp.]
MTVSIYDSAQLARLDDAAKPWAEKLRSTRFYKCRPGATDEEADRLMIYEWCRSSMSYNNDMGMKQWDDLYASFPNYVIQIIFSGVEALDPLYELHPNHSSTPRLLYRLFRWITEWIVVCLIALLPLFLMLSLWNPPPTPPSKSQIAVVLGGLLLWWLRVTSAVKPLPSLNTSRYPIRNRQPLSHRLSSSPPSYSGVVDSSESGEESE